MPNNQEININPKFIFAILILVIIGFALSFTYQSVPAGHVGVATLFGAVRTDTFEEGMHFPVNPLYKWTLYDARQKTHKEEAGVPTQDQLTTSVEVSVQYRLNKEMASLILQETGTAENTIQVHLIPKLRSLVREQGKAIKRAEDFFQEETQQRMQDSLTLDLREFLHSKGIIVQDVLIRDIKLPPFITQAIEKKKEREQEVEKQKAELERFTTEQKQIVVEAEAKRQAAEQEAGQRKLLADARAYEIQKINDTIADNPAYIKLEALKALTEISKDPAAKIYFLNSDSPMPLPLMHMGDK